MFNKFWHRLSRRPPVTRSALITISGIIAAGFIVLLQETAAPQQNNLASRCNGKPCNVILIILDTVGARHMSLYGYERKTTPFLDSFFDSQSVIFSNVWSTSSWTLPSFTGMLASRYPSEIHRETKFDELDSSVPTLIDILRNSGVAVTGFFAFEGQEESADFTLNSEFSGPERFVGSDPLQFLAAKDWLKSASSRRQPFFLLIHSAAVQPPYDPPLAYRSLFYPAGKTTDRIRSDIAELLRLEKKLGGPSKEDIQNLNLQYDQELRFVDDLVRDLVGSIPQDALPHTAIVLTGDHGESFAEHGIFSHAYSLYEELLHVPLAFRMPGVISHRIENPVSLIDLAPTIIDIYGIGPQETFTGKSLYPSFFGGASSERVLRAERVTDPFGYGASRSVSRHASTERESAFRLHAWKLIRKADRSLELYDLKRDPGERNNLISQIQGLDEDDMLIVKQLLDANNAWGKKWDK